MTEIILVLWDKVGLGSLINSYIKKKTIKNTAKLGTDY